MTQQTNMRPSSTPRMLERLRYFRRAGPNSEAAKADFAQTLRDALKAGVGNEGKSWTQESFGAAVGVSKDTVANWVNGRAMPNEVSFGLILRVLTAPCVKPSKQEIVERLERLERLWKAAQSSNGASRRGWIKHGVVIGAAAITAAATIYAATVIPTSYGRDTREYLNRFEDGTTEVGRAREAISERLWEVASVIRSLNELMADPDPVVAAEAAALRERFIGLLARGDGSNDPLAPDLHEIVVFYETVDGCITARDCNPETVRIMLGGHAETFWTNWHTFVLERQELQPDYGRGLQRIAANAADK